MATVFLKVARYSLKERIIINHNIIITIIYKFATAPKAHYIVHMLVKNLQDESMLGKTDKKVKKKVNILIKKLNKMKIKFTIF